MIGWVLLGWLVAGALFIAGYVLGAGIGFREGVKQERKRKPIWVVRIPWAPSGETESERRAKVARWN